MQFKQWLVENFSIKDVLRWSRETETDDTTNLLILADALDEVGYPNVDNFRNAIDKLIEAERIGTGRSRS